MDIGECANVHDLALRADYEAASKDREYGYELDVSILSDDDLDSKPALA